MPRGGLGRALVLVLTLTIAASADARVEPGPVPETRADVATVAAPGLAAGIASSALAPPAVPGPEPATVIEQPEPVSLRIAAIGVDTTLLDLGLQDDGTLEVPPEGFPAGWYTGAPRPGAIGPAVIAGHVDWDGEAGVFWALRDLEPGDTIEVTREDGSVAIFATAELERVAKDAFPTDRVYGDLPTPALRLITCGGEFDERAGSYRDNLVAYADLVEVRPAPNDVVPSPDASRS